MSDEPVSDDTDASNDAPAARRLSYKFQRLRERIRTAIEAGELAGKLPGERSLARQFNVNAKTLSKALTDLAAEGVLERNIGLGTFVRGGADAAPRARLLLVAGQGQSVPPPSPPADGSAGLPAPSLAAGGLAEALRAAGLDADTHPDASDLPPSLLAPYDVVLADRSVGDETVRDLIVRGKAVITLDRLTAPYATHAVLAHAERAAADAARHLAELGHTRALMVHDADHDDSIHQAMRQAAPSVEWQAVPVLGVPAAVADGFTGAVCVSPATGRRLMDLCRARGLGVPDALTVVAFGRLLGPAACLGYYVTDAHVAAAVADLLRVGLPHRPLTLWLAGECLPAPTTAPPTAPPRPSPPPPPTPAPAVTD